MHSLNAVFLLGDTALNCLVSFLGSFHKSFSSFFNEIITNLNLLSLSEVSFVSDRVFLHLDYSICPIPVDCPCHFQTLVKPFPLLLFLWNQVLLLFSHCTVLFFSIQVAISFPWLVISVCSFMVLTLKHHSIPLSFVI